jgi:hypothetical protein
MSTSKRAVAARIAERRAARAERRHVDRFDVESFRSAAKSPVIAPATGEFRQIVRWVRRHYWAVRAVLVAIALTLTVLALVGQVAMPWCASGHGGTPVHVHSVKRFSSVCVRHASGTRASAELEERGVDPH